jgi:hypothetical protein
MSDTQETLIRNAVLQATSLDKAKRIIEEQENEIIHLKAMLMAITPVVSVKGQLSPEETICHLEIGKLMVISSQRELDNKEVEKFERLVKTLALIEKNSVKEEDEKEAKNPAIDLDRKELALIAAGKRPARDS